jgi:ubiquinone/menaquinone biosynthesis C-methylase UbiE
MFLPIKPSDKLLVIGAGYGYEVVNYIKNGYDVQAVDIFVPEVKMVQDVTIQCSAEHMPFDDKEFDICHCTEMLEHVPEDVADRVILEAKRVSRQFVFTIATRGDAPFNTHINIHPGWWWMDRFDRLGMKIVSASHAPRLVLSLGNYFTRLCKPDGVIIYGDC